MPCSEPGRPREMEDNWSGSMLLEEAGLLIVCVFRSVSLHGHLKAVHEEETVSGPYHSGQTFG